MKWFEGNIPEAIQEAKNKQAVFIVYISGDDDISKQMNETWEDPTVAAACESCVGLKIAANSTPCAQFANIYPVVVVPCTFFIGDNGHPMEVTGGHLPPDKFIQIIRKTIGTYDDQTSTNGNESTPEISSESTSLHDNDALSHDIDSAYSTLSSQNDNETDNTTQNTNESVPASTDANANPEAKMDTEETVAQPAGSSSLDTSLQDKIARLARTQNTNEQTGVSTNEDTKPGNMDTAESNGAASNVPFDEKLERAQEVIRQKQEEKAEEEDRKQRQREIERREQGRSVTKLREWQKQKELKEAAAQYKKDKEEEKKHKALIKEQIARDRAERAARFKQEKEERQTLKRTLERKRKADLDDAQADLEAIKRETARIQFRLPDGSSVTEQFASSETLGLARTFLKMKVGDVYGQFGLAASYPRRDFDESHMTQTLLDLDLAPSASLIVIPGSQSSAVKSSSSNGGDGILWLLLSPFIVLWNFIYNLIFAAVPTNTANSSSDSGGATESQADTEPEAQTSPLPQSSRPKSSYGTRNRKQGNVHKFSNPADEDSDEDRTTWNGNSTQQM